MGPHGEFLIDFMDALAIPSATLAGHSMGGIISAYASIAAPEKVDALVMIEPGFYNDPGPAFLNYMFFPLDRIMSRQFYTRSMRERFFMGSFYNKSLVTDEIIDAYMIPTRTPNALEAMTQMMRTVGLKPYPGVTEHITRPTLLVWGERGPDDPLEHAKRITSEVKDCKLARVPESGHYIQEEKPEELAQIIRDYLQ
jgi:pimeloyl-ACP methyl ester carboxylesterase